MTPTTDRLAGGSATTTEPSTGGARQAQDAAAGCAPVARRGRPSPAAPAAGEGPPSSRPAGYPSHLPGGASTGRTYTIALPAGLELLNANDRSHWTRRRRITAALREASAWLARQQRIPRLARVRIVAVLEPPDSRRRDAPNWYPSFKAAIDGLVDAGVILDDSDRYVSALEMRCGERCPRGRIVLHVTEVAEMGGAA